MGDRVASTLRLPLPPNPRRATSIEEGEAPGACGETHRECTLSTGRPLFVVLLGPPCPALGPGLPPRRRGVDRGMVPPFSASKKKERFPRGRGGGERRREESAGPAIAGPCLKAPSAERKLNLTPGPPPAPSLAPLPNDSIAGSLFSSTVTARHCLPTGRLPSSASTGVS